MVGCQAISHANDRQKLRCAGRGAGAPAPGSSNGVVFMTPENEIGIAKIAVWPKVMAQIRKEAMGARLIEVEGRIQSGPEKKRAPGRRPPGGRSRNLWRLDRDALCGKPAWLSTAR